MAQFSMAMSIACQERLRPTMDCITLEFSPDREEDGGAKGCGMLGSSKQAGRRVGGGGLRAGKVKAKGHGSQGATSLDGGKDGDGRTALRGAS
jgi:hypothetical protein